MPEVKKIFASRPIVTKPRQYLLDEINWRLIVSIREEKTEGQKSSLLAAKVKHRKVTGSKPKF
jgi:hypothetical protein